MKKNFINPISIATQIPCNLGKIDKRDSRQLDPA